MTGQFPLLSVLLWLPIVGGVAVLAAGRFAPQAIRWLALFVTVLTFAVSVPLWTHFDSSTAAMQFTEKLPWISSFNVYYSLGVDGIAMPLILLNTFITILVVIAGWEVIQ